jgi:rubrerythrin
MDDKAHKAINDLIRLDIDAVGAYRTAIDACEVREIRKNLTEFMRDHVRHIRDLSGVLRAEGVKPASKRDVKGVFIKGFTSVVSHGDRSALMAMMGNEKLTNAVYKSSLEDGRFSREARQVIQTNYADEKRHLAWIQMAVKERAWEHKEAAEAAPTSRTVRRATAARTSRGRAATARKRTTTRSRRAA